MIHVKLDADTISIEGALTRDNVVALRDELLVALGLGQATRRVRLCNVKSVDSAGVQLLHSLVKAFPELRLSELSGPLRAALVRMGASSLLGGAA